jgi:hypothetical protein
MFRSTKARAATIVLVLSAVTAVGCTSDPAEPTGTIEPDTTAVPGTRETQPDGSPQIDEPDNGLQGTPGAGGQDGGG